MKTFQFEAMAAATPIPVRITIGKHKGKSGMARRYQWKRELEVVFDDASTAEVHYKSAEFVDENGEPVIVPVTDMSGREIDIGAWLVYSAPSSYNKTHALEVGQVMAISPIGQVTVHRRVQNGGEVKRHHNAKGVAKRVVNDPDRSLLMPVDTTLLTTWVLKGFENFKDVF